MINIDEAFCECEHDGCDERIDVADLRAEEGGLDLVAVRQRQHDVGWLRLPIKRYTTIELCPRHVRRLDG